MEFIGTYAFSQCKNIRSVVIEDAIDTLRLYKNLLDEDCILDTLYLGRNINVSPFSSIKTLKHITLSKYVTGIDNYSFQSCSALESVEIGDGVTYIGASSFRDCTSLKEISIPNSVTDIEENAFTNCLSLDYISIGNGVATIGNNAFYGCKNINSVNINNIANWCNVNLGNPEASPFVYAKNVYINDVLAIDLYIPDEVSSISKYAFNCCASISKVEFSNSIKSIGDFSFKSCNNLTEIIIGSNVSKIGNYAFQDCNNLKEIISHIPKDKLNSTGSNAFSGVNKTTCTLYVPYGAKEKYSTTPGWKDFKNIVEIKTTYKVTFVVDDKEFAINSVAEGDKIIYPEIPPKDGYTFKWDTIIDTMPSNDITLKGRYIVNKYLFTYKVDGEIYASDSIAYGAAITPIAAPTKEGHTFSGWSEIPEIMPANNVVIKGSFSVNSYTVTYMVDGEVYKADTLEYGTPIVLIDEPTKEGYTFSGWSEAPETMPAEDIIISGSFVHTSISGVSADATVKVSGNTITVAGANGSSVAVYSANGALVEKIDCYAGEEITLGKGVYIVRVGNKTMKVWL